jgi:reactive chlorine resistance protein C
MNKLESIGFYIALYGMALVLIWIGIFKFTPTEANAIKSFVEPSPLMGWVLKFMPMITMSKIIGSIEIVIGTLLILQPISATAGMVGGILSALTFATTLTFLFSTPNAISKIDGLWIPDGFLLKDLISLGFSIYVVAISARSLGFIS